MPDPTPELVVLVDDAGTPIGTADKATVHTTDTPLHLAFSVWLLDDAGRILLTRRALSKRTWPGVWTNSFCGHPAPGESTPDAIARRALVELGIPEGALADVKLILPDFRYRAVDSSGIVENEICPVYVVRLSPGAGSNEIESSPWGDSTNPAPGDGHLDVNPNEVDSYAWVDPANVFAAARTLGCVFSPWMVDELAHPELRHAIAEHAW